MVQSTSVRVGNAQQHTDTSGNGVMKVSETKSRLINEFCILCSNQLNTWDKKCYTAFKMKCMCEKCISSEMFDITVDEFRDVMEEYFGMRPCKGI